VVSQQAVSDAKAAQFPKEPEPHAKPEVPLGRPHQPPHCRHLADSWPASVSRWQMWAAPAPTPRNPWSPRCPCSQF